MYYIIYLISFFVNPKPAKNPYFIGFFKRFMP
jgi:hypothetical protein